MEHGAGPPKCRTVSLSLNAALKGVMDEEQGLVIDKLEASAQALSFLARVTALMTLAILLEVYEQEAVPIPAKSFDAVVMNIMNAIALWGGAQFEARANNALFADVRTRVERLAPRLGVDAAMLREHVVDVLANAHVTFGSLSNPRHSLEQTIARDFKACLARAAGKLSYQLMLYAAGLRWPGRKRLDEEKKAAKQASAAAREHVALIKADRAQDVPLEVHQLFFHVAGVVASHQLVPRLCEDPLRRENFVIIVRMARWLKAQGAPIKALFPSTYDSVQFVRYDAKAVVSVFPLCKAAAERAVRNMPNGTSEEHKSYLATFKRAAFKTLFPGLRSTVLQNMSSFTSDGTVVRVLCTPGGASQRKSHGGGGKATKPTWLENLSAEEREALASKKVVVCDPNLDDIGVFRGEDGQKFRVTRAAVLNARDTRRRQHDQERARNALVQFNGQTLSIAAVDKHRRTSDIGRCVDLAELTQLLHDDLRAFVATWPFTKDARWRVARWRTEQGEQRLRAALMYKFSVKFGTPDDVVVFLGKGSCFFSRAIRSLTHVMQVGSRGCATKPTSGAWGGCAPCSSSTTTASSCLTRNAQAKRVPIAASTRAFTPSTRPCTPPTRRGPGAWSPTSLTITGCRVAAARQCMGSRAARTAASPTAAMTTPCATCASSSGLRCATSRDRRTWTRWRRCPRPKPGRPSTSRGRAGPRRSRARTRGTSGCASRSAPRRRQSARRKRQSAPRRRGRRARRGSGRARGQAAPRRTGGARGLVGPRQPTTNISPDYSCGAIESVTPR